MYGAIFLVGAALFCSRVPDQTEIRLRPGDAVAVVAEHEPTLCATVRLDPNGVAKVPLLGMTLLAGLSPGEAARLLSQKGAVKGLDLGPVLVSRVFAKGSPIEFRGALRRSGEYPAVQGLRLVELLAYAEPTQSADLAAVRIEDATGRSLLVDARPGASGADTELMDGDRVYVPLALGADTVLVLGAVARPGLVPVRSHSTLLQVIEEAGGLVGNADPSGITLERAGSTAATLSLEDDGSTKLVRGDVVRVPFTSDPKHVYVLGFVAREGRYDLSPGMKLSKALEVAGGVLAEPVRLRVSIARRVSGELRRTYYDLAAIREGRAPDVELQPGDIVEVLPRLERESAR